MAPLPSPRVRLHANSSSGRRLPVMAAVVAIAATVAAAGCGEKSEPAVHPPTTVAPTITGKINGSTTSVPAPPATTPTTPAKKKQAGGSKP
jgi:hypothetical protein